MTNEHRIVGQRHSGIDAMAKAVGVLEYVSDLKMPRMLTGKVLRSTVPHGEILNVDTSRAKAVQGVRAVITARDISQKKFCFNHNARPNNLILQDERVRFVGDQVAAVAAVDEDAANEALSLIRVEYRELPAVFDPEEAMGPDAVRIHDEENNIAMHGHRVFGDVDKAFAMAHFVHQATYETPGQAHACMEPRGCVAHYHRTGGITVWTHSQSPHYLRHELATMLNLPQSKVSVIQAPIGGAFGAKIGMDPLDGIAAFLSMNTGCPVSVVNDRREEFTSSRLRYPIKTWIKSGVDKSGRLMAREIKLIVDNGAYNNHGQFVMANAGSKVAQLYAVPNIRYEGFLVYTNNVYGGAFRGYGNPQITFAMETQLEEIAGALNMDPVQIRLVNANRPNSRTVSGCQVKSCGLKECIETAVAESGWREKKKRKSREGTRRRGIGMACMMHGASGVKFFYGKNCNTSAAVVKVTAGGSVDVLIGTAELGQGSTTAMAMIAAETLSVPLSHVNVIHGQPNVTPPAGGAFGSRQVVKDGNAVKMAAEKARAQIFETAAEILEAPLGDLVLEKGRVHVGGSPGKSLTIAQIIAERWHNQGKTVQGEGLDMDPHAVQPDPETGIGNVSSSYAFAAQVAEVEVDLETHQVEVLGFWCAHDVGKAINVLGAEGQIEGGVLSQGLGFAVMENLLMGSEGVKNADFADYKIPTIRDICPTKVFMVETDDEYGPYGAKGLGEPPMIPTAPAIANAIHDAMGVMIRSLPMTPEKIFFSLNRKDGVNK